MGKYGGVLLMVLLMLILSACDSDTGSQPHQQTLTSADIIRVNNPDQLRQGQALYVKHCAHCHGQKAEGDLLWRRADDQGHYPPPPLDGTGHAWHHSRATLHNIIKNGSAVDDKGQPQGRMPAWGQTLDDAQIKAMIAWFQSLWPDPVYSIWYNRQQHARGEK